MRHVKRAMLLFGLSIIFGYNSYTIFFKSKVVHINKPHIIIIIADDMGWNDVSFHGSDQIPTPNIDALAYNGVILNRHYVLPICTPSRTSLMTGRYPIRDGMQGVPLNIGVPSGIPLNITLMPEHIRRLGYNTHLLGKWHLGYYTESHTPTRRGFDTFFGYYNGFIGYFDKTIGFTMNDEPIRGYDLHRDNLQHHSVVYNNSEYFTDLITNEAVKIIKDNGNKQPLFLQISHLAVHSSGLKDKPLEVRNQMDVDETFNYIQDSERRKYAGVVKSMDDSVGEVIKALSDAQMFDNSIILFMSDNGAPTIDTFKNFGSNYPLRGLKDTLFEGGIRGAACIFSPLINKPSRLSQEYIHISDWLPTLYSAAGGNVSNLGEIDGVDQWRSLVNGSASPRMSLLINIDENRKIEAAIFGKYKLVKDPAQSHDDYYGHTVNDYFYPKYNVEDSLNSLAGRAISRLSDFTSVSAYKARKIREKATVKCQHPKTLKKCLKFCLFDIISDPCETQNLSNDYTVLSTLMLRVFKFFIQGYRDMLLPQTTTLPIDSCSFPQYFNGTWMPWKKDDHTLIKIIPEACRNISIS